MPSATVAMPAATAPLSPKPSGFTKPAGFGRSQSQSVDEDDEPKKDHPVIIALAVLSVLLMAYVCYLQFGIDQMPNRQSDDMRVFGAPSSGDSGADYSDSSASDDSDSEEDSGSDSSDSSEDSGSDDSEDDE